VALGVPVRVGGHGGGLDVERDAQPLEVGAELRDVVAVHEVICVAVEQVDGRPRQHERHLVLPGHDADADSHGLERAAGCAPVLGDEDEDRLVGHDHPLS